MTGRTRCRVTRSSQQGQRQDVCASSSRAAATISSVVNGDVDAPTSAEAIRQHEALVVSVSYLVCRLVYSGKQTSRSGLTDVYIFSTRSGTRHGVATHVFRVELSRDLSVWSRALVEGAHNAAAFVKEVSCRECSQLKPVSSMEFARANCFVFLFAFSGYVAEQGMPLQPSLRHWLHARRQRNFRWHSEAARPLASAVRTPARFE